MCNSAWEPPGEWGGERNDQIGMGGDPAHHLATGVPVPIVVVSRGPLVAYCSLSGRHFKLTTNSLPFLCIQLLFWEGDKKTTTPVCLSQFCGIAFAFRLQLLHVVFFCPFYNNHPPDKILSLAFNRCRPVCRKQNELSHCGR